MTGIAALAFLVLLAGVIFVAVWTQTDGYKEQVRMRRALNELELERLRREIDLDLRLKEWQQSRSLEDLERHRRRLERELDEMHGVHPDEDGPAEGTGPAA